MREAFRFPFHPLVNRVACRWGSFASGIASSSSSRAGSHCVDKVACTSPMMAVRGATGVVGKSEMAAAGGFPTIWSAFSPSRMGRGGAPVPPLSAVAKADSDDSVMDKKAEFYGNSAPGAVAPVGAEKQDEAAVDYAVAGDWEKSLQLIKAMR